ncbi:MAG TPA: hypothetical protein VK603_14255 [Candidatus Saccharimonadales bacterium]|nr:hypothetical protein [Candidatus Saccharimonadales bacterium]
MSAHDQLLQRVVFRKSRRKLQTLFIDLAKRQIMLVDFIRNLSAGVKKLFIAKS